MEKLSTFSQALLHPFHLHHHPMAISSFPVPATDLNNAMSYVFLNQAPCQQHGTDAILACPNAQHQLNEPNYYFFCITQMIRFVVLRSFHFAFLISHLNVFSLPKRRNDQTKRKKEKNEMKGNFSSNCAHSLVPTTATRSVSSYLILMLISFHFIY